MITAGVLEAVLLEMGGVARHVGNAFKPRERD